MTKHRINTLTRDAYDHQGIWDYIYELGRVFYATYYRDELNDLARTGAANASNRIAFNTTEGSAEYATTCTTSDYLYTNVQINHDWEGGLPIYPHLHWWQASATIPNWLLQYRWQINGGAKTTAWTSVKYVSQAFTYSSGTLNQIAVFGAITPPTGYGISDIVQCRIIRDTTNASTLFAGADGLNAVASGVSFDIHMPVDMLGSRTEYTK